MSKTPQQKKSDEYDRDHRNTYEFRNAAVKAFAKGKKRREREHRRAAKQLVKAGADVVIRRKKKEKKGVIPLREKVKAKKEGRRLIA